MIMLCPKCNHGILESGASGCWALLDDGSVCPCKMNTHDIGKHYMSELDTLRAELTRTREALTAAGELLDKMSTVIKLETYGDVLTINPAIEKYQAALARLAEGRETG